MGAAFESLMQAGIQAPSADNDHVFCYQVLEDGLDLVPREGQTADKAGHERVLALLSLGAVLANIELRAASLGMRCTHELLPEGRNSWMRLRFASFEQASALESELAAAIDARHTDRRLFGRAPLPVAVGERLQAVLDGGVDLRWLTGPVRSAGLKQVQLAETARFRSRFLHHELFSSIRFDLNWRDSASHRLPPAALAIEAPMRPMFKLLRHWPLMRALRPLGVPQLIAIRAALVPSWFSAGIGVITVPAGVGGDEDAQLLSAGRGFERVWLRANAMGLAVQPLAASAVLQWLSPALDPDSANLAEKLRGGWDAIWPGRRVAMVFRIGKVSGMPTRTGRLPLAAYLR